VHHEIGECVRDVGRVHSTLQRSTPGRGRGPTRRRGCAWTRATATACVERPRRAVDMPRIRRRSEERAEKDRTLGWRTHRRVVERTHPWMNRPRHCRCAGRRRPRMPSPSSTSPAPRSSSAEHRFQDKDLGGRVHGHPVDLDVASSRSTGYRAIESCFGLQDPVHRRVRDTGG